MAAIQAQVGMKQYPVQPQVNQESLSIGNESTREAKTDTLKWFVHLLQTRPMAFWSGVWVSVFLVAIVAVGSLISPNAAERRSVSAIAIGSDSVVATQPLDKKGKVPFWLFGAIAVTCTAGSLLVSRQLNSQTPLPRKRLRRRRKAQTPPPSFYPQSARPLSAKAQRQRRKPAKHPQRLKPYSPSEAMFSRPHAPQGISPISVNPPGVAPRRSSAPSFTVSRTTRPQNASSSRQPGRSQASTVEMPELGKTFQPVAKVPVTVVPQDQIHPLDWKAPRLADAVDLRRRKSIKSWM